MPYTDTTVNNLIINVLDKDTYDGLTPNESELYLITDDDYLIAYTSTSFSSLPQTFTVTGVDSQYVVVNSVLSNPAAQTGDWTITTSSNSVTVSGSISGTTTLTLYLDKYKI